MSWPCEGCGNCDVDDLCIYDIGWISFEDTTCTRGTFCLLDIIVLRWFVNV